ncbi:hypothetical protein KEM52_004903 [Ascosphaera acerosa]|nr:hypothetical protein KEM52_004903 [Ascosphaera acerosa]
MVLISVRDRQIYDGPISESIPSSSASFIHRRRPRRDSNVSYTFYQSPDENEGDAVSVATDEDDRLELPHRRDSRDARVGSGRGEGEGAGDGETISELGANSSLSDDYDVEAMALSHDAGTERSSASTPLLGHSATKRTTSLSLAAGETISQKLYLPTEDLNAVITGFKTSKICFTLYLILCLSSFGVAYLILRWMPRWRVRLIGCPVPLAQADWVVVENEWGEFSTHPVSTREYQLPLYTLFKSPKVFSPKSSPSFDDEYAAELPVLRSLDYRYIKFFYNPLEDGYFSNSDWKHPSWSNVCKLKEGLEGDDRDARELVFGPNLIDIEQKSVGQILVQEALHPFYIFQVASLILWSLDEYYYYAACIFIISVFSIGATVIETRSTMHRLKDLSHFECDIHVLRSGFWRSISSKELVPGDVFEISDPSLSQVPCDCLLLSGDAIVNESMLTGESVPVSKTPATSDTLEGLDLRGPSVGINVAKNFLFAGTKIIRARRPQSSGSNGDEAIGLAMVVRTGFNTTKGALVRTMLFPKPAGFKFYRDSFRYISVMAGIAAVGFVASLINFIEKGLVWTKMLMRALDLITIVIPPALPATLSIGTNFAISRLKKQKIFCISPQRVNVGGMLNIVCFDKTGTLTEDGLDIFGVRAVRRAESSFSEIITDAESLLPQHSNKPQDPTLDYSIHQQILFAMATCHSLRLVDGELIGDPLDLRMFQYTGWMFEEGHHVSDPDDIPEDFQPAVARPSPHHRLSVGSIPGPALDANVELGIVRTFEFASQLRRQSVVVHQRDSRTADVFVKGAPESMREVCRHETIPPQFNDLLAAYTHNGYRVIALASKTIKKYSLMKVMKADRSDIECDLEFLGFIIFENKLKPITASVIQELNAANIRNVMCTGDNILTAISVARECGMIDPDAPCFVPRFVHGDPYTDYSILSWEATEDSPYQLDPHTLKLTCTSNDSTDPSSPYRDHVLKNYSVAVSGEVFRWIVDFAPQQVLHRMLVTANIFARMSPDEKHELVEKLQTLDYRCGFCGDGANDCGALKAADVGISLSEAEASVAAPFTSRVFDISCVPKLIREGRAALVTSFCCFKYMSLYSAIQFTTVTLLYAYGSNLGDFQFLYIDLILILPVAIFMGWLGPSTTLCRKRPTSNLVSRKVLVPLLGQMALCIFVQAIAYENVHAQPWYRSPKQSHKDTSISSSDNTVLFLLSCFQYIFSGMVLSIGRPFRQPMTSNVPFVCTCTALLAFTTTLLFHPSASLSALMQLTFLSAPFKVWLLAMAVSGFVVALVAERKLFPDLARLLGKLKVATRPAGAGGKQRKKYKILLDELGRPY